MWQIIYKNDWGALVCSGASTDNCVAAELGCITMCLLVVHALNLWSLDGKVCWSLFQRGHVEPLLETCCHRLEQHRCLRPATWVLHQVCTASAADRCCLHVMCMPPKLLPPILIYSVVLFRVVFKISLLFVMFKYQLKLALRLAVMQQNLVCIMHAYVYLSVIPLADSKNKKWFLKDLKHDFYAYDNNYVECLARGARQFCWYVNIMEQICLFKFLTEWIWLFNLTIYTNCWSWRRIDSSKKNLPA